MPRAVRLAFALLVLLAAQPAAAQVIYVDADAAGANTGVSWADAFTDLQDALAVAGAGDEVWVAEGVYKPTDGSDRMATFSLTSGVGLYGGFDGTETSRDERDWVLHETVLSGNLGDPTDEDDNAFHVVTASGTDSLTVLDGFTVRDGLADVAPEDNGGGLLIVGGSPTIRHGTFRENGAGGGGDDGQRGGGIYVEGGSPLVENCLFEDNVGIGGGFYASGGSPTLRWVTFRRNRDGALAFGAGSTGRVEDALFEGNPATGVYVIGSSPRFVRTTFRDNHTTGDDGGAVLMDDRAAPVFEDALFEDNSAVLTGGAVQLDSGSAPLFLRTTFRDNYAGSSSGAVDAALSAPVFLFCHFERNRATFDGGAVGARSSGVVVLGSTFVGNTVASNPGYGFALTFTGAPWQGRPSLVASTLFAGNEGPGDGAVTAFGVAPGEARMVNVTFAGNRSRFGSGGALAVYYAPGLSVENAVLWGDEAPDAPGTEEVPLVEGGGLTLVRSLVAGGCPAGVVCTDVLGGDPLFVRPPSPGPDDRWGTADDDYGDLRLREGSPAEDWGLSSLLPPDQWDLDGDGDTSEPLPVDVAGGPRVLGGSVDAGAHEGAVPVGAEPGPEAPTATVLLAVHPNPSRGVATVALTLTQPSEVAVSVYDALGRRVAVLNEGSLEAGRHAFACGAALPAGVYVVRVVAGGAVQTQRLTLVR